MSREEAMKAFIESGMELRRDDIELGKKLERERIIKLLENEEWHHIAFATRDPDDEPTKYHDGECFGCRQIALIKGEQK